MQVVQLLKQQDIMEVVVDLVDRVLHLIQMVAVVDKGKDRRVVMALF
jgi:hypothetical protein